VNIKQKDKSTCKRDECLYEWKMWMENVNRKCEVDVWLFARKMVMTMLSKNACIACEFGEEKWWHLWMIEMDLIGSCFLKLVVENQSWIIYFFHFSDCHGTWK